MLKTKLYFAQRIAEDALQHHFTAKGDGCLEFRQIRKDCLDFMSIPNTQRIYAKLIRLELNERAVKMVIRMLTDEKRQYLHLRYRRKKSIVAVSLALHVSVAQLNLWHHGILEQIARFMLLTLKPEDVLHPGRVAQMIRLQAETIKFFSEIDPTGTIVTKDWLLALIIRHREYKKLLAEMKYFMDEDSVSLHERIVAARLNHPDEPEKCLARSCHVHKCVVSRHLREFEEDMSKYLV